MRHLIKLVSTRFLADDGKFGVFTATEIDGTGSGSGQAYVVFKGTVPESEDGFIEVWGDWTESARFGNQFVVRSWIRHASLPGTNGDGESDSNEQDNQ